LRGKEIDRLYASLPDKQKAVFVMGLIQAGLVADRQEADAMSLEALPAKVYEEFREFLRSKQVPIVIEYDTKEEKQN
jgi:hypothetical protein